MASLTKVAITTRRIIRYSIYLILFIIFARLTILVTTRIYRHFFPEPPPPPTLEFGKLPDLPFPLREFPSDVVFTLQTPDEKLPKLTTQAKVFFMPQAVPNIRAVEFAREQALKLGFNPDGRELVETVYLFQRTDAPASLNMNIVTGVFSISYDLNANPSILQQIPPPPEVSVNQVKGYLTGANLLPNDIRDGPTSHEFIRVEQGQFVNAFSLSESDFVKINLFRKDFDEIKSLPPDFTEANVWFMLSGSSEAGSKIVAAEYHYFPLDEEKFATYPLKTSEQAWEELKAGRAFIANYEPSEEAEIFIRRVYVAYYDAGQYTEFYQPVIVFEGDNNFAAYVPGIASEYYGEENEQEQ